MEHNKETMLERWETGITNDATEDGSARIRGKKDIELMQEGFGHAVLWTLFGETLSDGQKRIIEAFLAGMVDHGIGVASVRSARMVASTGAGVSAAIAAGVLAAGGPKHGGAVQAAAAYFEKRVPTTERAEDLVQKAIEKKERIPGFGHKVLKEGDPRADVLLEIAKEEKAIGPITHLAQEMEEEFEKQKGKKLPLNVDGVFAALLVDMGIPSASTGVFFLIARTVGIAAHVLEENQSDTGLRRLEYSQYTYTGDEGRK